MLQILLKFLLLAYFVFSFHFYLEAGERKSFREELSPDTSIVGAFAAYPFNAATQKYEALDSSIKVEVLVTHESTGHVIAHTTTSQTGKFHFTANEQGVYLIQISVNGGMSWFGLRSKVNLDIQYGGEEAYSADHSSAVLDLKHEVNDLIHKVSIIRSELRLQRDRESELRELSEMINSHTYRFTLVQIFVLVLTAAWQLRQLKQFFTAKKLV